MKTTLILTFLFFHIFLNINAKNNNYSETIDKFKINYNNDNFDAIFEMYSSDLKKYISLDATKQFLTSLKFQVGNMQSNEFIKFDKVSIYKSKFEKGVLSLNITLNENNEITSFSFKPYTEEKVKSDLVNQLKDIPDDISEPILKTMSYFPNYTQLSIAILNNNSIKYYGVLLDSKTLKNTDNYTKIFEIGSLTKVFTSTLLSTLVKENKLNLDEVINKYYPFKFNNNIEFTFKSLANHTSGLPRMPDNIDLSNLENPYINYNEKHLNEYLKNNMKLENKQNEVYLYSNLGTGILGYTIGLSQNIKFRELLESKIFKKYNMNNTFTDIKNIGKDLVKGLDENGNKIPNWEFDILFPAGGILSTTEDLSKFVNEQFNPENKNLQETHKKTFTINENMSIALGWHILKNKKEEEFYWHNGGTRGYSSSIAFNTTNKTAIIILSNVSAFSQNNSKIDELCFELLEMIGTKK